MTADYPSASSSAEVTSQRQAIELVFRLQDLTERHLYYAWSAVASGDMEPLEALVHYLRTFGSTEAAA